MKTVLAGVVAATMLVDVASAGVTNLVIIDFEGFDEETEISDQYAALGVTFAIEGRPDLLPIIAEEGAPTVAFNGSGNDNPMADGIAGLTDPIIGGDEFAANDIRVNFDPPVTSIRFFYLDLDNGTVVATAFDGMDNVVDSVTKTTSDPGTGNGQATEFFLAGDGIESLLIDVPAGNNVGYAIDFLSFTRPCTEEPCGQQIVLAQESAPGAGDFDDNILANLVAYPGAASANSFYAYNVPAGDSWNGQALTPVEDRSHLLLARTTEGLSLVIVHDRAVPNDPDGGASQMSFELINDADGAEITVQDDPNATKPNGFYAGEPGDSLFTVYWTWNQCCTDGMVLSGLDDCSTMLVTWTDVDRNPLTPAIDGLTEWVAYSADGTLVPLALEEDRRVRLQVLVEFAGDLNNDGQVNQSDLGILLAAFGLNNNGDLDCDGDTDQSDLGILLANFGNTVG